jgi:hypothetical protein
MIFKTGSCQQMQNNTYVCTFVCLFFNKKPVPYTLTGFDLTNHSYNLLCNTYIRKFKTKHTFHESSKLGHFIIIT